jgi:hypothetical protein
MTVSSCGSEKPKGKSNKVVTTVKGILGDIINYSALINRAFEKKGF